MNSTANDALANIADVLGEPAPVAAEEPTVWTKSHAGEYTATVNGREIVISKDGRTWFVHDMSRPEVNPSPFPTLTKAKTGAEVIARQDAQAEEPQDAQGDETEDQGVIIEEGPLMRIDFARGDLTPVDTDATDPETGVTTENVNRAALESVTNPEVDVDTAIEVLRGQGFIVPSAEEAARIAEANSAPVTDSSDDEGYVTWNGSFDAGVYDANAEESARIAEEDATRRAQRQAEESKAMFREMVGILGHVKFPSDLTDAYRGTLALWTIHTWTYMYQDATPYILLTSPVAGSGKSTALSVLASMTHAPAMEIGLTASNLMSYANDGCTVLIDEADELTKDKQFKAVINSGYKASGFITRKVGREQIRFSTYSPKAIAGIARDKLPVEGATLDRCINVKLQRALPGEVTKFRPKAPATKDRLTKIRAWVKSWAEVNGEALGDAYPEMPELATNRTMELWEPLLAIAEALGDDIAAQAREWAVALEGTKEVQADPNAQLVNDVKAVLDLWRDQTDARREDKEANPKVYGKRWLHSIRVNDLCELRNGYDARQLGESLSSLVFGRRLAAFGIQATPDKGARWYKVLDESGNYTPQFADLFNRYANED